jgi:cell division GTPase FtsZ
MGNKMGISFTTDVKRVRDDGGFKTVVFQASKNHRPLELVFSQPNSDIIEREDWQAGDQVIVKIERVPK